MTRVAKPCALLTRAFALSLLATGALSAQEPTGGDSAAVAVGDALQARPLAPLQSLVEELTASERRVDEIEQNLAVAEGAQIGLFEFQRRRRWIEHHDILVRLGEEIGRVGAENVDSATVAFAAAALERELLVGREWLADVRGEAFALLEELPFTAPDSLVEKEIEFSALNAGIDQLMAALADDYELAPTLGLDVAEEAAAHDSASVERAELLSAVLEFAQSEIEEYRSWLVKPGVDTVAVDFRIAAAEERVTGMTASLEAMSELLARRGFDTAEYRRLIVATTGVITTEVLDTRVLGGLLAEWGVAATEWLMSNLTTLLFRAVLILLLFVAAVWLSRVFQSTVRKGIARLQLSSLVKNLIVSGSGKLVWLVAALFVLSVVGVDLGPMLAGLGIVGFVVGFALQDTLANFASGLMIMIYRPFDVGDFVTTGGVTGKVKDLTLVSTVIQTLDNKRIIVPNNKVWGDVINNATAERIRRVDLVFGISYADDVDQARAVLEDLVAHDERVLTDPEPMVRVDSLGDSSVNLICRPWCRTEDVWELKWDLTRAVKKRFDAEGITIPFPQRDVHVYQEGAATP
jgi:small conductance mechanosensitive channel